MVEFCIGTVIRKNGGFLLCLTQLIHLMKYNSVAKIREHYDLGSEFYKKFWGKHIHHGYFETGKESKEVAAEKLIKLLVKHGNIKKGSRVLDVGCGVGGTSIWLAQNLGCKITGISISPVQIDMAKKAVGKMKNAPQFFVQDANDLNNLEGKFDVIWAVEMISHLKNRADLFKNFERLLAKGGKICITDWMKDDKISQSRRKKFIEPIEKGMLVDLPDLSEYKEHFDANGLRLKYYEDINEFVSKTWDMSLGYLKSPALWKLAKDHRKEFSEFVKSFYAIRKGFKEGSFRYGIFVIEKP